MHTTEPRVRLLEPFCSDIRAERPFLVWSKMTQKLCGLALLACAAWGCEHGSIPLPDKGHAGSGGAAGSGGEAGGGEGNAGGTTGEARCSNSASRLGSITLPNPMISLDKPVTTSSGTTGQDAAVDGIYHGADKVGMGRPTPENPAWIAIDVGTGPSRLLLVWTDASYNPYNIARNAPRAYSIETSSDSTDGEDGTWQTAATVEDNPVRSRAHSFGFDQQRWVRMTVTEASVCDAVDPSTCPAVNLDEIALYDLSDSGDERPEDTWFFMGDSITAGAFERNMTAAFRVDSRIHDAHEAFDPATINGGIGGELATDGLGHVDDWLQLNPDLNYFAIGYGTNDSWGDKDPVAVGFEDTMVQIVEAVLDAGHIPVLARIPYASVAHSTVPAFNAIIDDLQTRYDLPCGPDLYGYFAEHPDELGSDGIHPTGTGYASLNGQWADAVDPLYADP